MYLSPYYDLPTQEAFRYHFRPTRPVKPSYQPVETDTHRDLRLGLGSLTDRQQLIKPWTKDPSGPMSERAELDYRMAPDIVRKDAPFGNIYTPNITVKIIGGRSVPVIEAYPVGTETYGNRLQTLQPITEKPNHLDPRTFGDNPKGYYNNNVQVEQSSPRPTATVNKRPDSKDITRSPYNPLPPIQANRTKNDMSTVFEAEAWTGNRNPNLAKETEYKTNFYTEFQASNDMDQQRSTNQRPSRDHLYVSKEEEQQLNRLLPSSVLLPTDPIDFGRMQPVLMRLIASEMGEGSSAALKDVYLEVCRHDKDLRSFCPFEILAKFLANHQFHIPHLRLVAAQYVDPQQPGKVNYEEIIKFLGNALKLRDRGEMSNDRPKYYMSNGESGIRTGSLYKDREVAKLLRTVEAALSTYSMDWTKYRSAFNKMDRDHRDTLSASQIKDICYDFRLPLSESLMDQILALCEDNNRDGQYRWEDFLDFIGKVRPMNTGLPMPRHSPRRDGSPVRGGYTDRFDGPPGGYTGRGGGGGGDYGYSQRDGYGYDDNPRRGQYRFDDQQQRGGREYQIKQLSEELRDLETKYNITQEAMKSHEKPWPDRYIKMTEALYNSDVSNKGCLPWKDVEEIVRLYNDSFNLNLDMTYAELVARNNTDRSGNVMLRPFLLNLSSEGRLTSGRRSRGRLY